MYNKILLFNIDEIYLLSERMIHNGFFFLEAHPPSESQLFFTKIDFEISTYTESQSVLFQIMCDLLHFEWI